MRCVRGAGEYDEIVDPSRRGFFGWLPPALRRLEHGLGAQRDDRTLWVWAIPAATVVITFVVMGFIGLQGQVDLALTLPMALVLSVFLGSLSAFYLTAASSDERDADDDDRRRPRAAPPPTPPSDSPARVVAPSAPRPLPTPETPVDEAVAALSGSARHR